MTGILGVLVALLVLSVLVIIHELGHFLVAKLVGIKVLEFSLFMGPKLVGFKKGETEYSIRLIPLGGFVKMEGEEEASDDERAFNKKPIWARTAVIAAGPIMNILLGILLFSIYPMIGMGAYPTTEIGVLSPGYPAEKANMMTGDRILKIDGERILVFEQISYILNTKGDKDYTITVRRGDEILDFVVRPQKDQIKTAQGTVDYYRLGFIRRDRNDLPGFFAYGFNESLWNAKMIFVSIQQLITGKIGAENLSGPIGIVSFISEQASPTTPTGESRSFIDILLNLIYTGAFLTINLGVFNILPIPALDGSKLIILAVEKVRKRPIPPEREAMISMIGFIFLIGLMIFATFNDVTRIFR